MKRLISFSLLLSLLFGCGQSEKELQEQQELAKIEAQILEDHEDNLKIGLQKRQTKLDDMISSFESSIEMIKDSITETEKFKIGRSQSTKDKQLAELNNQLMQSNRVLRYLKNQRAKLEVNKSFLFQTTPKELMLYVFQAAEDKDYSKLIYLCDPYGEGDSDINAICLAGALEDGSYSFNENFGGGRIIGEPVIDGDRAEVEIAIGPRSSQLGKITLIKRYDAWYLLSF